MPKRKNIFRVDSGEVQGEDSYVVLRRPSWGAQKLFDQALQEQNVVEMTEKIERLLCECIKEWNWVDDDGNPLPTPHEDPSVLDRLVDTEITFLIQTLQRSARKKRKN